MRRDHGSESGFVLAEALISVALLSLMIALVASAIAFGQRVAAAGLRRDRLAETAAGLTAVANLLKHAAPDRQVRTGDSALVRFEGLQERLSFLTVSQGDALPAGLVAVTLSARLAGGRAALVMETAPVAVGGDPADRPTERLTLIEGVDAVRFRYLGPSPGAASRWLSEWRDADRMPRLVGLEIRQSLPGRAGVSTYLLRPGAE